MGSNGNRADTSITSESAIIVDSYKFLTKPVKLQWLNNYTNCDFYKKDDSESSAEHDPPAFRFFCLL